MSQDANPAAQAAAPGLGAEAGAGSTGSLTSFPLFPSLPPEIRHDIWRLTFGPRVLEIHAPRRPHYAELGTTAWQTSCLPHPTLLVSRESRNLALRHYRIAFPLASSLHGGGSNDDDGVLYLSRHTDILVVLGEMDIPRIIALLKGQSLLDPDIKEGGGLLRLGLNARSWGYVGARNVLKSLGQTRFAKFHEFVLVLYADAQPPVEWKGGVWFDEGPLTMGNEYRNFRHGRGQILWDGDENGWMFVGKNRMRVLGLKFVDGWRLDVLEY